MENKEKDYKFCNNWNKCCSECMDRHTHLCQNSCFYKPDFNCKECKHRESR